MNQCSPIEGFLGHGGVGEREQMGRGVEGEIASRLFSRTTRHHLLITDLTLKQRCERVSCNFLWETNSCFIWSYSLVIGTMTEKATFAPSVTNTIQRLNVVVKQIFYNTELLKTPIAWAEC